MGEVFDLGSTALTKVSYHLDGKTYVLKEATAETVCRWRNALLQTARFVDGKQNGFDGTADIDLLLVSLCLFEQTDKGETAVSMATLRAWPYRIQKVLLDKARAISCLEDSEGQGKNLPPVGTAGSN